MNTIPKHPRIFAVAPSSRGFGFAVIEGQNILVDWGVKETKKNKNAGCIAKLKGIIEHYKPQVIVLEDVWTNDSRRHSRIRMLSKGIVALASRLNITVLLFSRSRVRKSYFTDGEGTKHGLAEIIAQKFPDELGSQLPPKRKPWMTEDYRMGIFDAVALALMIRLQRNLTRDAEMPGKAESLLS